MIDFKKAVEMGGQWRGVVAIKSFASRYSYCIISSQILSILVKQDTSGP